MTSPALSPNPLTGEVHQGTLSGSGGGQINITPGQAGSPGSGVGAARGGGYSWDVTSITVTIQPAPGNTGVKNSANVSVYMSWGILPANPSPADLIATTTLFPTASGPSTGNCLFPQNIRPGDWIMVVIANGDDNSVWTVRVYGNANPPGSK